jgi:hypothetical protein
MASGIETVTTRLRELILAGELDPGARLMRFPWPNGWGVAHTASPRARRSRKRGAAGVPPHPRL